MTNYVWDGWDVWDRIKYWNLKAVTLSTVLDEMCLESSDRYNLEDAIDEARHAEMCTGDSLWNLLCDLADEQELRDAAGHLPEWSACLRTAIEPARGLLQEYRSDWIVITH